jgi:hypothetical protein
MRQKSVLLCLAFILVWLSGCLSSPEPRLFPMGQEDHLEPPARRGSLGASLVPDAVGRQVAFGAMELRIQVWPVTACDESEVRVPSAWMDSGRVAWLLCYETPTPETSENPWATIRPNEVVFYWQPSMFEAPIDLEAVSVPAGDGPTKVAVLVSLPAPPDASPLFNARNTYGESFLWAAQPNARHHDMETHGRFELSRVLPGGTRVAFVAQSLANGCVDPLSPEFGFEHGACFRPMGEVCPETYYLCAPGRYHCAYEP